MGSSYTKQENCPDYREIPIDNSQPWEFAECFYESYCQLANRVQDLEEELILLKENITATKPSPKVQKIEIETHPPKADACCQTEIQSVMEIEPQTSSPRRLIKCTSLKKKIYYTKVYTKKHVKREVMEIECEKKEQNPKSKKKRPQKPQRYTKIFVRKEGMEIEVKTKEEEKSPPKRRPARKTRHKGTPEELASKKKRKKKNIPDKALDGSDLNLNIKNLSQPNKVTLITDFFVSIQKIPGCDKDKSALDPKT
jgi:hypothetical protein